MKDLIVSSHTVIAIILLLSYGFLAFRLFRKTTIDPLETTIAMIARIAFLLAYLTGLLISMNLKIFVPMKHHYASVLPVFIIFLFQFMPNLLQKERKTRSYAWMFLLMLIAIIVISVTSYHRVRIDL